MVIKDNSRTDGDNRPLTTFVTRLFLLLSVLTLPLLAQTDPPQDSLTQKAIQERLDALAKASLLEGDAAAEAKTALEAALENLRAAEASEARARKLDEDRALIPAQIAAARERLAQSLPAIDPASFEAMDEAALTEALRRTEAEVRAAERETQSFEGEALRREAKERELLEQTAVATPRIEALRLQLAQTSTGEPEALLQARTARIATELRKELAGVRVAEAELKDLTARKDFLPLRKLLSERTLQEAREKLRIVTAARDARRQAEADRRRDDAKKAAERMDQEHQALRTAIQANASLASEISVLSERKAEVEAQAARGQETLTRLDTARTSAERRIDVIGLTPGVGRILRKDRQGFARPEELKQRLERAQSERAKIAYGRIEREEEARILALDFEAEFQRRLEAPAEVLEGEQREAVETRLRALLQERRKDLERYAEASQALVESLSERVRVLESLLAKTADYFAFIDRRILWIQSADPLWTADPILVLDALRWPYDRVKEGTIKELWPKIRSEIGVLLACGFAMVLWLFLRLRFVPFAHSVKFQSKKGMSILPTFGLFGAILVRILPLAGLALMASVAIAATNPGPATLPRALQHALLTASGFLAVPLTLSWIAKPRGLGEAHFAWDSAQMKPLRRALGWYIWISVPAVFFEVLLTEMQDEALIANGARLALLLRSLASIVFFFVVLHPKHGIVGSVTLTEPGLVGRLRWLWFLVPLLSITALSIASVLGYHFTAGQLIERAEQTAGLVVGLVLMSALMHRALLIGRRRLVQRRAVEREGLREVSEEGTASESRARRLTEGGVAIEAVDAQTRILSSIVVASIGIAVAWWIWSDMLPAIDVLDQVKLWSSSEQQTIERVDAATQALVQEVQTIQVPVTLKSLLVALLIVVLTILGTRNLPGALEVVLLQHLPLGASSRYAITAMLRQLLVIFGIAMTLGALGLHWSQIQWLVAAMGVGLGFGLQEIFANFISGMIVLFERRVRIGDIVTVGDVTGTVARVQTLASTIVDWDRKEYILPNKDLVTGRILNWTRTDTVSRMVIPVGVAYGSDTKRAREILLQSAQNHPLVMREPAPLAVFESLGDSTLNLSLRCFVPSIAQRLLVQTELLDAIVKGLTEADIEIAFPQRDVHLKADFGAILPAVKDAMTAKSPEIP